MSLRGTGYFSVLPKSIGVGFWPSVLRGLSRYALPNLNAASARSASTTASLNEMGRYSSTYVRMFDYKPSRNWNTAAESSSLAVPNSS